jgi:hypothetical protein
LTAEEWKPSFAVSGTWRRATWRSQALALTAEERKPDLGASGQDLFWEVIGGQGVLPGLLPAEFFCNCVPGPHFKMKIEMKTQKII